MKLFSVFSTTLQSVGSKGHEREAPFLSRVAERPVSHSPFARPLEMACFGGSLQGRQAVIPTRQLSLAQQANRMPRRCSTPGDKVRVTAVAVGLTILTMGAPPARAQPDNSSLWGFAVGIFDLFQNEGYRAPNLNVEWRGPSLYWTLRPMAGVGGNIDGAVYGYGGIAVDLNLGTNFVITPSFAPTIYSKGDSKDLHSWFEFRSGIEFAYRFEDRSRLGLALHHLSHAGLGGDSNPGTEILSLYYLMPLSYPLGQ